MKRDSITKVSDAMFYFMNRTNGKNELRASIYKRMVRFLEENQGDNTVSFNFGSGAVYDKQRKKNVPAESLHLKVAETGVNLMLIFPKDSLDRFMDMIDPTEQGLETKEVQALNATIQ